MTYFPARKRSRQSHAPRLLLRWRGRLFLERFDLETDRLDIGIDALVQERALHDIELLAASVIAPAFQGRHLVRELVDLQLLSFDFRVAFGDQCGVCATFGIALGELCDEGRGQISQLSTSTFSVT
jgi:hypothetical protein